MDLFYILFIPICFIISYIFARVADYRENKNISTKWEYSSLKRLIENERIEMPAMLVNLEQFDKNVRLFSRIARTNSKTLRIGTKSVRNPFLIKRIFEIGGDSVKGLMCYSVNEAKFLSEEAKLDDLFVAYPTLQETEIETLCEMRNKGVNVSVAVDSKDHLELISDVFHNYNKDKDIKNKILVVIDVDVSYKLFGFHIGVQRSPIRDLLAFKRMVRLMDKYEDSIQLVGVMTYEAQIAGIGDKVPKNFVMNQVFRLIKKLSIPAVQERRKEIVEFLKTTKYSKLEFFNGGGTGNAAVAAKDPYLTEICVGSGFLQSHIFDYYQDNKVEDTAFLMALPICRSPERNVFVLKSGGFVASGGMSVNKFPKLFLPTNGKIFPDEGFGEVQTPIKFEKDHKLRVGDPVFFRASKAGEISEHFNEYYIIDGGYKLLLKEKTYRGHGKVFY